MLDGSLPWFGSVSPKQPEEAWVTLAKNNEAIEGFKGGTDFVSSGQIGQILVLLFVCAVGVDGPHNQGRLDAHCGPIATVYTLYVKYMLML
jgi:hypothetical protein